MAEPTAPADAGSPASENTSEGVEDTESKIERLANALEARCASTLAPPSSLHLLRCSGHSKSR
jgi:hypothetical protein